MRKRFPWLTFLLLLGLVLCVGYSQLSESKKRFIANTLRQVPYLFARYQV